MAPRYRHGFSERIGHNLHICCYRLKRLMRCFIKTSVALALLASLPTQAVEIYPDMPKVINPNERYVIYSHGLIVEGTDPTPTSPEYGLYDFPGIKRALFASGSFNLIAHQRPKDTQFIPYVDTLESWVNHLLKAGVRPSRITLVGFSRGSHLTAYASARLRSRGINTALLASCSDGDIAGKDTPLVLSGNLLNIYETTDVMGSCTKLAAHGDSLSFKEIAITTGKKHGAFFQPLPEWVKPLRAWIDATNR
jgi:hypothetical protein